MNLTLDKVWIVPDSEVKGSRPATLADLVEVLKQEGAWIEMEPEGVEWKYSLVLPLGDIPKRPDLLDNDPPEGEVFSWYT